MLEDFPMLMPNEKAIVLCGYELCGFCTNGHSFIALYTATAVLFHLENLGAKRMNV